MPFLKNSSLRIIYVADIALMPGGTSEVPEDAMEHSGVKALMAQKQIEEVDDPSEEPKPRASAPKPSQPPQPPKKD